MNKSIKYWAIWLWIATAWLFTLNKNQSLETQTQIQKEDINLVKKSVRESTQIILEDKPQNNSKLINESETKEKLLREESEVLERLSMLNKDFIINNKQYFQSFKDSYLIVSDQQGNIHLKLYKWIIIANWNHKISINNTEYITVTYQDKYDTEIEYTGLTDIVSWNIIYEWYLIFPEKLEINWERYYLAKDGNSYLLINVDSWGIQYLPDWLNDIRNIRGSSFIYGKDESGNYTIYDYVNYTYLLEWHDAKSISNRVYKMKDWDYIIIKYENWLRKALNINTLELININAENKKS